MFFIMVETRAERKVRGPRQLKHIIEEVLDKDPDSDLWKALQNETIKSAEALWNASPQILHNMSHTKDNGNVVEVCQTEEHRVL